MGKVSWQGIWRTLPVHFYWCVIAIMLTNFSVATSAIAFHVVDSELLYRYIVEMIS